MRIAIIGGGFCGVSVARKLRSHDVFLFDRKDYFEYTPSVHKMAFEKEYASKIRIPYTQILNAKIITETIKEVTPEEIITSKKKYPFDYLVICSGIDYPIFLEHKKDVYVLKNGDDALVLNNALQRASSVLVIGGGLIGTEIAAEIAVKAPAKKLTVVHPHPRLLERNPERASRHAQRFLEKRKASLVFGEKVVQHDGKHFVTDKGNTLTADIAIWCAGVKCDVRFLKGFTNVLTERGALKVNEHLQLEGYNNIYSGGDICSVAEEKTAQNAGNHAKIIAKNISCYIHGKPLLSYAPHSGPMVISLGDYDAITVIKGWVFTGILQALFKKCIELFEIKKLTLFSRRAR